MATMFALLSLGTLLLAAWVIARMLRPASRAEFLLLLATVLSAMVVALGYLLSMVNRLASMGWWAAGSVAMLALACIPLAVSSALRAQCLRMPVLPRDLEQQWAALDKRRFDIVWLLAMGGAVALAAAVNFLVITGLEPANIDGFCYHLSRMAYYLQHGNLRYFDANYWAQVVYPKVATVLMLYTYLVSGRFINLTQLVQFLAYGIAMVAVYGIAQQLGGTRRGSLFAALAFGLLPICLLEAASPQNDLLMAAFVGCTVYFLLAYRTTRAVKYLPLAALAFALAAGVKATIALVAFPLLVVALFALWIERARLAPALCRRHATVGLLGLILALVVLALPAGYGENWQRFGNPFGPQSARARYTSEDESAATVLRYGTLNLLRYGMNFLAPDGVMPPDLHTHLDRALTWGPKRVFAALGVDLQSAAGTLPRFPFRYQRGVLVNENNAFWGLLGVLLLWPAVLVMLLRTDRPVGVRVFAAAVLVFFVVQAYVTPYDPFRGRFFTMGAIFAAPVLAFLPWSSRNRWWRGYLSVAMGLACITALSAVLFRSKTILIPFTYRNETIPSAFVLDRTGQLTREAPELQAAVLLYEDVVPAHATVAIDAARVLPDFLFFGDGLTRRLIPLHPFTGGTVKPLPPEADYLLCSGESPYHRQGDLPLWVNHPYLDSLYLRKLR